MVDFSPFGQVGGKTRPDGVDNIGIECKHDSSTGLLGWGYSRIMFGPAQQPVDLLPGHEWSTLTMRSGGKMTTTGGAAMAKVKRNGPCPCGSGNKAKRCCYGNQDTNGFRLLPPELSEGLIEDLVGVPEVELRSLFDRLLYLPEMGVSLQVRLPGIITPDMNRAINALRDGEDELFDEVLEQVVAAVDTDDRRVELARAVIDLRDQGRLEPRFAAIAVLELDLPESMLFRSSVAESLAVLAGDQRTPAGLLVATR
jgi:hypothetical protein